MPLEVAHQRRRARNPNAGITQVRPLTTADLARLKDPIPKTNIARIREMHHEIAMYVAMGKSNSEISDIVGIGAQRIGQIIAAPNMKELISVYANHRREARLAAIDEMERVSISTMHAAERVTNEFVAETLASDTPPSLHVIRAINKIAVDRMDRFGYGKTSTNVNVNLDFAKKLETAIARSRKVIEA